MKIKNIIKQDLLIGAATITGYAIGVLSYPVSVGIIVSLGVSQSIAWIYNNK